MPDSGRRWRGRKHYAEYGIASSILVRIMIVASPNRKPKHEGGEFTASKL